MKLVFITNTFPSVENIRRGLFNFRAAKSLRANVELDIVHLRAWKPFRNLKEQTTIHGLPTTVISLPLLPSKYFSIWGLQLWFYKRMVYFLLKKQINNNDVIHTVGASFSGIVGSFLSQKTKTPHISQCIGSDVNFSLPKIKNTLGIKGWETYVDIFTCNSKALSGRVKQLYPSKRSDIIYRGVDLSEFRPTIKKHDNPFPLTFLFIGGLSMRSQTGYGRNLKGGLTLLQAWKKAFSSFKGNSKPKLIFGGPEVTQELVSELLQVSNFDGLNLDLVGELTKEDVVALMSVAHLVIVPSIQEGLPNVAFEAMASGCALMASNVGGIPEIVENNVNGLLCKEGNENELAEALLFASQNPEWVINVGKQNRNTAEVKYDSKKFTEKYLALYQWLKKE